MEKLRTALVGAGKVAHLHAAALRALPESEFVAVCSRPSERLGAFADRYGVRAFTDVAEMVDRARVQAPTPAPATAPALPQCRRHRTKPAVRPPATAPQL